MSKINNALKRVGAFAFALCTVLIVGCFDGGGGGGGDTPGGGAGNPPGGTTPQTLNVTIAWTANNEKRVSAAGGGYKVYINKNQGFDIANASIVINVPWVSGVSAPISTVRAMDSGKYYVRVVAYTAFPVANTMSLASPEKLIDVPFTAP